MRSTVTETVGPSLSRLPLEVLDPVARHYLPLRAYRALTRTCNSLRNALLTPSIACAILLRELPSDPIESLLPHVIDVRKKLGFCPLALRGNIGKVLLLEAAAGRRPFNPAKLDLRGIFPVDNGFWRKEWLPFALTSVPSFRNHCQSIKKRCAALAVACGGDLSTVQCLREAGCFDADEGLARAIWQGNEHLIRFLVQQGATIPRGSWGFHRRMKTEEKIHLTDIVVNAGIELPEAALDKAVDDIRYLEHVLKIWNGKRKLGEVLLSRSFGIACKAGLMDAVKLLFAHGASVNVGFHRTDYDEEGDDEADEENFNEFPETPLEAAILGNRFDVTTFLRDNGAVFTGEGVLPAAARSEDPRFTTMVLDTPDIPITCEALMAACSAARFENAKAILQKASETGAFNSVNGISFYCFDAAVKNDMPEFCDLVEQSYWDGPPSPFLQSTVVGPNVKAWLHENGFGRLAGPP
ncbi:hypothetical protein DFJ77DRAFT_459922 [Powellomyces hirtus]|nr:hypothetical protein DFJ77DRAFT_459922 [Powellomyces hirtus]